MKKWPWVFGLVTGVVLAWVFSPEKGSVLRKKMSKQRAEGKLGLAPLKRDVVAAINDATGEARKLYKSGKVKELAHKGEETLKEIGGQVTKHFKNEIELIKELYKRNNGEEDIEFEKHALIEAPTKTTRAKKSSTTKKKVVSRKSSQK